jgi:DnaJ-class molecular chaperone
MTQPKLQLTRERCPLCRGTGASNPDAEHSTDWRDYLPCMACRGTGYVLKAKTDATQPAP